jgi:hypothetical protein
MLEWTGMHWGKKSGDPPEPLGIEMHYVPVKSDDWRRVQMAFIRGRKTFISVSLGDRTIRGPVHVTMLWPTVRRATYRGDSPDLRITID